MSFNIEFRTVELFINPENEAVRIVRWLFTFTRDGYVGYSGGETVLSPEDETNFIPLNELSDASIEVWVREKIGGDHWNALHTSHEDAYQDYLLRKDLVTIDRRTYAPVVSPNVQSL